MKTFNKNNGAPPKRAPTEDLKDPSTNEESAANGIDLGQLQESRTDLRREVTIMSALHHPSLLPLVAACAVPSIPLFALVMPIAPGASIDRFLTKSECSDPVLQTRISAQVYLHLRF